MHACCGAFQDTNGVPQLLKSPMPRATTGAYDVFLPAVDDAGGQSVVQIVKGAGGFGLVHTLTPMEQSWA
eukprot:356015-Chlamydomonas_euryale.AAC.2